MAVAAFSRGHGVGTVSQQTDEGGPLFRFVGTGAAVLPEAYAEVKAAQTIGGFFRTLITLLSSQAGWH
jgi:hypothetical protein